MQKLVDGIHKFQKDVFATQTRFFERLADGQKPLALFITCSDSRIDPSMLTQTKPGELFIMRNAGNIVPPYGASSCGEAATIEYAVAVLGVRDIVVCGHSHCGAMTGLLHPDSLAELPLVRCALPGVAEDTRAMRRRDALLKLRREGADHASGEAAGEESRRRERQVHGGGRLHRLAVR